MKRESLALFHFLVITAQLYWSNGYGRLFSLRAKIKTIGEKFETRELHYKALLRSKDAEIQSLTAKYEEQRRGAENEASRCRALSSQVSTFSHTESELRSQLNIYVEKFKQVWICFSFAL